MAMSKRRCIDCGTKIFGGPRKQRCDPCRRELKRLRSRNFKSIVEDLVCMDCKKPYKRNKHSGPVTQRCPECRLKRKVELNKVHKYNCEEKNGRHISVSVPCGSIIRGFTGDRCDKVNSGTYCKYYEYYIGDDKTRHPGCLDLAITKNWPGYLVRGEKNNGQRT